MNFVENCNCTQLWSLSRHRFGGPIARLLVVALVISQIQLTSVAQSKAKPIPAKWRDLSCTLPGDPCASHTALYAGVGAAGAGLVAVVAWKMHNKGNTRVKLDMKPVKFTDFTPGQLAKVSVPLRDMMNAPITVKEVTVDDPSGAVSLGDARQGSFSIAPGEAYDIPVTLNTKNNRGKARIRVVATSERTKKDVVQYINFSYRDSEKHHGLSSRFKK